MGRRLRAVVVAVALVVLAACDGGGGGEVESVVDRTAAVYDTVLRWVLADRTAPRTTEEDELPVVYVVGDAGVEIDSEVQATVVKSMLDDATVRFGDEREEALDENLEGIPVLDEGVLVLLGPVPDQGATIDMPVEVYLDEANDTQWELVVARSGTSWAVSSARLVS